MFASESAPHSLSPLIAIGDLHVLPPFIKSIRCIPEGAILIYGVNDISEPGESSIEHDTKLMNNGAH
jgi:hypothetical protein